MQDLPEVAFFTPAQAATLLDRGDRSILALSYRWLTASHPEPRGTTLNTVRKFLQRQERTNRVDLTQLGLFWDFGTP